MLKPCMIDTCTNPATECGCLCRSHGILSPKALHGAVYTAWNVLQFKIGGLAEDRLAAQQEWQNAADALAAWWRR
ncbi:MAG: hypothetical protein KGL44_03830 [Sphingomonadales bacterium]|nr:hypothetical protein [Sphingomonadales bacterium]